MGEVIQLRWPAHVGERFEESAFAASVGKEMTIRDYRDGEPSERRGRLLSAQVADGGLSVVLEVEVGP